MDTQKLTNLAVEGNKEKIKEYRNEITRTINSKNILLMRTKSSLERVKLIPGADETVAQLTKSMEETVKIIQDAWDALDIIDKWAY